MLGRACNVLARSDPYCYCIMDAVFKHDSAWATAGVGRRNNNPGNLRCLEQSSPYPSECIASPGNGYFAKFESLELGIYANVDLYNRKYRGKPPEELTRVWAGDPKSPGYWEAISACFQ